MAKGSKIIFFGKVAKKTANQGFWKGFLGMFFLPEVAFILP